MIRTEEQVVIELVRIGLGIMPSDAFVLPKDLDWDSIVSFSRKQGIIGVMADGLAKISLENMPERRIIMRIMGSAGKYEKKYDHKLMSLAPLAKAWNAQGIRISLLKGMAYGRYYPNPKHRTSSDVDVYLSDFAKGNEIAREKGANIDDAMQVHTKIAFNGIMIENHQYCCGQVGNKKIVGLNKYLISLLKDSSEVMQGTCLLYPQLMFDALFCIYHARNHFVIEDGIQLRHVLDWVLIRKQVKNSNLINELVEKCEKYGLTKFYHSFDGVAAFLSGEISLEKLDTTQIKLLKDILKEREPKKERIGERIMFVDRIKFIARILENRWKYPLYSDVSFVAMMWIYVKGYLKRYK